MNRCKYCGKPLTLTPEYDTCMECQGRIMREATMPQNSFTTNLKKLSMNIYDEALRITKNELNRGCGEYYEYEDLAVIQKALEHAKKEHELLELYREKDKLRDELFNEYTSIYSTAQSLNKIVNDFKQIQEQINILEKELEELK